MRKIIRGWMIVVALTACVCVEPVQARENLNPEDDEGHAAITYVGTVVTNLFYTPTKVVYAGLGGFIGGLAYVLTGFNSDAFFAVWDSSGGGTYFVTPSMLEGRDTVYFVGK